jgi:hypothetical protein
MEKEMSKLNQNIVHALSYALNGVESYTAWLEDAKNIERMVYHENFEELLRDTRKAVDMLRGMVEGHVKMSAW